MKFSPLIIAATVASVNALAPPTTDSRRAFLSQAASTTATAFTAATVASSASPAFAKDDYALDVGGNVPAPVKTEAKKSSGGGLVAGALGASVALSLPFFLLVVGLIFVP